MTSFTVTLGMLEIVGRQSGKQCYQTEVVYSVDYASLHALRQQLHSLIHEKWWENILQNIFGRIVLESRKSVSDPTTTVGSSLNVNL